MFNIKWLFHKGKEYSKMAKDKVFITAALTGAVTPKAISPHHPISPDEIAADVVRCAKAGASVVHLHARDENAQGTMSVEVYDQIWEKVQAAVKAAGVDVVINLTTSGTMYIVSNEERVAHVQKLKPEMMSFDIGSFNWGDAMLYDNNPQFLRLAGKVAIDDADGSATYELTLRMSQSMSLNDLTTFLQSLDGVHEIRCELQK